MDAPPPSPLDDIYTDTDLLQWIAANLPLTGTVHRVPGRFGTKWFHYVALPPAWEAAAPLLLGALRKLYQYNDKVQRSGHKLLKLLREKGHTVAPDAVCDFVAFPSETGMHISIAEHTEGTQVPFTLDHIMTYENQKAGAVSPFDATLYCACYLAIRVTLQDATVKLVSSTHISVAAFALPAARVTAAAAAPAKGKGKK